MKKRSMLAIALIVAAAVLIVVLSEVVNFNSVSAPRHLGFVLGVCTHGNESSESYALENGVRYFRTDISLGKSQEALLGAEHSAYNASYLGILDYETLPGGSSNKNWSLNEWNASVASAIAAYPWIDTWEIWNEPLVKQFQTGYMNGSAYNYYMLIRSASKVIKAKETNATIVCFGGAPIADYQAMLWYEQVWSFGAYMYCNAVSIHAYPYGPELLSGSQEQAWKAGLYAYENFTHVPIWITEFGIPSSSVETQGYTQSLQSAFMEQGLALFGNIGFVKRVYWYDLWGLSDGTLGNNFGLLNLSNPGTGAQSAAWHTFIGAYSGSKSTLHNQ